MRRVCCFSEKWESGGIEAFLCGVLTHMDRSGLEIDIVTVRQKDSLFTAPLKEAGITVTELSGSLRSMKNAALFRSLLQKRQYDVIHFNLFQGLSLQYVQIAKDMGVPVRIVHSHGAGLRKSPTKPVKLLLHRLGRALWAGAATKFWTCSEPAARFLFGNNAAQIIPNGIEVDAFRFSAEARSQVRNELGLADETVVGTVSRLSGEKNQSFLLDVFALFHKVCPNSRLLLVGDGEERSALKEKAARLGIAEYTVFYGSTPNVSAMLSAMDIFVLPSLTEGLGIAAVEAQVSGLPVLVSHGVPAAAHLTPHLTALSLQSGAQKWADALAALTEMPRQDGADAVRDAGFDILDTARLVRGAYGEAAL